MSAAAVDLRSMSHSPSPIIESNNNIVDRKTGLPYHHKNVIGMKGTAGTTGNAQVNGTSSSHVHVYKESSISLKPTNGLQDQVPQQSNPPPQMYSLQPRQILTDPRGPTVSLAFKTPKLHYSNQLYIYPYYVVTFCESAQTKLEADVAPSLEKQIKYCNVYYFDFQPQQPQPPPEEEEEEEEEEEWTTEFYEETVTTVITETKTEAANAFQMQQQAAAAQQTLMYGDHSALTGPDVAAIGGGLGGGIGGGGGGGGGGGIGYAASNSSYSYGSGPPPGQSLVGSAGTPTTAPPSSSSSSRGGGSVVGPPPSSPSSSKGPPPSAAAAYNGPSLSDVISPGGISSSGGNSSSGGGNLSEKTNKSKGHSKSGRVKK